MPAGYRPPVFLSFKFTVISSPSPPWQLNEFLNRPALTSLVAEPDTDILLSF
jgi:hypothetical protein